MPQAERSSTTRHARIGKAQQRAQEATLAREAEAAAQFEAMLSEAILRAPLVIPQDHPDAALGKLCVTVTAMCSFVEQFCDCSGERRAERNGIADGDWIPAAVMSRWDDAAAQLRQARPLTHEGLRMKALATASALRTDAQVDAAGELVAPRELLALALAEDTLRVLHPEAPRPPKLPRQVKSAPAAEVHVPSRDDGPVEPSGPASVPAAGKRVQFVTVGRMGRSEPRSGTVEEVYNTSKGAYVRIRGDDGRQHKARPSLVTNTP